MSAEQQQKAIKRGTANYSEYERYEEELEQ